MIFTKTSIEGVYLIDLDKKSDERGFFARTFCREEFLAHGLEPLVEQCNVAFNHRKGTLRGMHMQIAPHPEAKYVRCIRGAIYDIVVDMRPNSKTRFQHVGVELSADNRRGIYIPPYFAHGYQALTDDAEVVYQVSGGYAPNAERGLRYNDPQLQLSWPLPVALINQKDLSWPLLSERDLADFDHI